jgi:hypothetical protein
MAILYRADVRPSKLALLNRWLPTRPWYRGPAQPDFERVTSYRFDDPAGQVGVETLIVRTGAGPLLQAPLTYRDAPLDHADDWLVGTAEHSVLGRRWVYDGCGDPVYAAALAATIVAGATQAEEFVDVDGRLERREPTITVRGTGTGPVPAIGDLVLVGEETDPTLIRTDSVELAVVRVLDDSPLPGLDRLSLIGTGDPFPGQTLLATFAAT